MFWLVPKVEAAPVGTAWTYQGRLMDANSVADGEYDFEFKLFDTSIAGSQQGSTIDVDPCFVNPNGGDFRLQPVSPCIDAGDSTAVLAMSVVYDLDGKVRYIDIDSIEDTGSGLFEFLDMGAYEFDCRDIDGDTNCDGVVDFKDVAILCGNWLAGK